MKSGLELDKQLLEAQSKAVIILINTLKSTYYQEKLQESDSKETFKILNCLLCVNQGVSLSSATINQELTQAFVTYFRDKVQTIHTPLDSTTV